MTRMTWMIVEDDPAIRDVLETMCELWDFDALIFTDGFKAMEYLSKEELGDKRPALALLDIRVPGPWGHEISARIREHPDLNNIGIILMTAYELPGPDKEEYLIRSGADRLIYKPLPSMDELLQLVTDVLEARDNS
ncbi:MAG: response regulator [Chloroflexi bacterium]|nr:response regulator [Chloroflexota bacterium]